MFKTLVLVVLVGLLGFLAPGKAEDQMAQAKVAHAAAPERVTAVVSVQDVQDMLDHLEKLAEVGKNLENKLGRPADQGLSSGGLEFVSLEEQLASMKGALSHRPRPHTATVPARMARRMPPQLPKGRFSTKANITQPKPTTT